MLNLLWCFLLAARSFLNTQRDLALENLALRHEIGVLKRMTGGAFCISMSHPVPVRSGRHSRSYRLSLATAFRAICYGIAIASMANTSVIVSRTSR